MVMFLLLAYFYVALGTASILMCLRSMKPDWEIKNTHIILFSSAWPVTMGIVIFTAAEHVIKNKTEGSSR